MGAKQLVRPRYLIADLHHEPAPPPSDATQEAMVAWTTASHTFKKNWLFRKRFREVYVSSSFWNLPSHVREAWEADNKD